MLLERGEPQLALTRLLNVGRYDHHSRPFCFSKSVKKPDLLGM
jgi:hypothetical protein